jgi:hypothetical protein
MLGARPGILLGKYSTNVLFAYHFSTLMLAGGDRYDNGPLSFYNAHRGEVEVSLPFNLSFFAGGGRRLFREIGRSRSEIDGGIGGSFSLHPLFRLHGALTARWHGAKVTAYDLWGTTGLLSGELRLPANWALRSAVTLAGDHFPHSAGLFDPGAPQTERRDILLKLSASGTRPLFWGLKGGVGYEYAERFSTTAPYDYRDHRLFLNLIWSFTADPWAPRAVSSEGHVPLDHGIVSFGGDERIQDLLRQEEAAQRSSTCVE